MEATTRRLRSRGGAALDTAADTSARAVIQPLEWIEQFFRWLSTKNSPVKGVASDIATTLDQRSALAVVLFWMVVASAIAAGPFEAFVFSRWLQPEDPEEHEARAALVVFACFGVATVAAWVNGRRVGKGKQALSYGIPAGWVPLLILVVTAGVGTLIGLTVFR